MKKRFYQKFPKDLTGSQFYKLTVLRRSSSQTNCRKESNWECLCSCGTIRVVSRGSLTTGHVKGCRSCITPFGWHLRGMAPPNKLPRNQAAINIAFGAYVKRAKKKNMLMSIDRHTFEALVLAKCFYCHSEPNPLNGLDRIDNSIGYVNTNVVACCWECNRIRGNSLSQAETKVVIDALLVFRGQNA